MSTSFKKKFRATWGGLENGAERVSEARSSEQRGRGAEEIITVGDLSRNCAQALPGL